MDAKELEIQTLAKEILVAMYHNEKVYTEDYKHNAIVAIKAAEAMSLELERRSWPK